MKIAHIGLTSSLVHQQTSMSQMGSAGCTSLSLPCFLCSCPGWWLCCSPWTSWPGWHAFLCSVWNCGTICNSSVQMPPLQACSVLRNMDLSPFLDEFELHGLLLLHAGQELLEVFTLLCDVAVLYLLLLVAVAADELWPLFSVLCSDVLYLGVKHQQKHSNIQISKRLNEGAVWAKCCADKEEAGYRFFITLVLWSVTSIWILSSVSFFNSWQLFSLWGDTMHWFFFYRLESRKWTVALLPPDIPLPTRVSSWTSPVVSPRPSFPYHAGTLSCPPGCSELSALHFDPVENRKKVISLIKPSLILKL